MRMRPPFLVLLLLLSPATAQAQSLDVVSAVQRAVTDRPTILASQAQGQSAASAVREARSLYLPKIVFSETFSMSNEPAGSLFIALNQERNVMSPDSSYNLVNPDTQQDFDTRLTLEQALFDADAGYRIKEAKKRLESAQARSDWSRESAGFAAFQAYLGVQNALAERQATQTGAVEANEVLRIADERYAAGIGLKADQLRAMVFHSEASRRALTARNNVIIAQRRLALAIGQTEGEITISAPLDSSFFDSSPTAAVADRADLQAVALEVESLAIATKRSQAAYLPRIDFSGSYALHNESSPFGADAQAWHLGAALKWELFDGFRRDASSARVSAEKAAAVANLSDARREQNFRRAEVELRIAEARARKESAEQGLVAAKEGQRLLQQRYESGLTDLVDLLATQSALDQARSFVVAADIQLLFSLGQALLEDGRFVSTILTKDEVSP
ncbi:MAG: hypothetical protein CVU69_11790 [Deltaproteobacteria bacterium HGW-Deltaproteobacteria-4]|nr:MAG: hypothetical protein CVU69_11790 [Deltaproteobacteria bacterium HGW-Deltaproteobacteria-4]